MFLGDQLTELQSLNTFEIMYISADFELQNCLIDRFFWSI